MNTATAATGHCDIAGAAARTKGPRQPSAPAARHDGADRVKPRFALLLKYDEGERRDVRDGLGPRNRPIARSLNEGSFGERHCSVGAPQTLVPERLTSQFSRGVLPYEARRMCIMK